MNKKILFIILCIFSCFMMDSVGAEDVCEKPASPTLQQLSSGGGAKWVKIYIDKDNIKEGWFYRQQLNGKWALCLDAGGTSRSNYVYVPENINDVITDRAKNTLYRRAYAFAKKYSVGDDSNSKLAYILSQIVVWAGDLRDNQLKQAINSAYCATFTEYANDGDESCLPGGNGYNALLQSWVNYYIDNMITLWNNTIAHQGNLAVYSTNVDGAQRLISEYNCDIYYACPNGDLGDKITACVKEMLDTNKNILENEAVNACRAEYCENTCELGTIKTIGTPAVCSDDKNNLGVYYEYVDMSVCGEGGITIHGRYTNNVNDYCNLYCKETATQLFPGNVKSPVSVGTFVIWPTSIQTIGSTFGNNYPLKFNGKKECYVDISSSAEDALNELVDSVKNEWGELANKYFETSRNKSNNCDTTYNSVCKNLRDAVTNLKSEIATLEQDEKKWQGYVNSANGKQDKIESCNACRNEETECNNCPSDRDKCIKDKCKNVPSYAYSACAASAKNSCKTCQTTCPNCNTICSGASLSDDEKNASSKLADVRSKLATARAKLTTAQQNADACNGEHAACNEYAKTIEQIITMQEQMSACATYTYEKTCSGNDCEIYNFETNVDLSWSDKSGVVITDDKFNKTISYSSYVDGDSSAPTISKIKDYYTQITKNAKTVFSRVSEIIKNRKLVFNANVTYSLPSYLNSYVVTDEFGNVKVQNTKPNADVPSYKFIPFGNLSVSFDALINSNNTYNLKLSNIRFGENSKFTQTEEYVCKYNVTDTVNPPCTCPEGTTYEGRDLRGVMSTKGLTCDEAKATECDYIPKESYECPDGSEKDKMTACMLNEFPNDYISCHNTYCLVDPLNCPPPNEDISLESCINNGYTKDYCLTLCPTDKEYKCSNSDCGIVEKDMSSCVITKRAQGLDENTAINECTSLVCSCEEGLKVIYRTISLENPFPGRTISGKVKDFNDIDKGRYPGTNWNNLNLVENHILNVTRNDVKYDGSAIYQGEPLYTFVLNTSTINKIRAYNDTTSYSDFNLDCRKNNSTACVSKFIHDDTSISGLSGGACANSTSANNFYTCSGD